MIDPVITSFLHERKEKKLKEELIKLKNDKKGGSIEEEVAIKDTIEERFSLGIWLVDGAKRACWRSLTTHPCTFSHPSSRSNHKDDISTSVIANATYNPDGYIRSGNIDTVYDSLGNAAAMDVETFLFLRLKDGYTLLEHIENETQEARELLSYADISYESIREQFLSLKKQNQSQPVTSSKIKQVYFPIDNGYHLLSILTNIGLVAEIKKQINYMKFSDVVKEIRQLKRDNSFSEKGFREVYNLTSMRYGGNKPQNISTLNSKEMGSYYLLPSIPPVLEREYVKIPIRNFFNESLWPFSFKQQFNHFHKLITIEYTNVNIREGIVFAVEEIISLISMKVWEIRLACQELKEDQITLSGYQGRWLASSDFNERDALEDICTEITRWIIQGYEKVLQKKAKMLGKEEFTYIKLIVQDNMEAFR